MADIPGGKGSVQRKSQISDEQMQANWDAIFGKKKKKCDCPNWTLGCCGAGVKVESETSTQSPTSETP